MTAAAGWVEYYVRDAFAPFGLVIVCFVAQSWHFEGLQSVTSSFPW